MILKRRLALFSWLVGGMLLAGLIAGLVRWLA